MMVLIIDDDKAVCASLSLLLKQAGYEVTTAVSPDEALLWLRHNTASLILMDMNYSLETSGREGIELLQKAKIFHPETPVILITGWGSIPLAVEGMRFGASDFITKPWDNNQLLKAVETNIQWADINTKEETSTRAALDKKYNFGDIIGADERFMEVLSIAGRIASTEATVLITGESGTGKELIAEAIHSNSNRSNKPFIKVNLGGMPESLFESEMFGHKRGAFTDAHTDRKGRFEMACDGTIFLDEIGELSLVSQVKLLRVLQEGTYEVLGDSKPRKTNVRVICATNKDLVKMVDEGSFREDLYYRINLIHIHNPELRSRRNDIPVLAKHFATETAIKNRLEPPVLDKEALEYLIGLPFPGNIRQLKNLMERVVLMVIGNTITKEDIILHNDKEQVNGLAGLQDGLVSLDEMEKKSILKALEVHHGNLSRVARVLGMSRGTLYRRLEKYGIDHEH